MTGLPNPVAGDTITASIITDIKAVLEGGATYSAPFHLQQSSGDLIVTMADNAGTNGVRFNSLNGTLAFRVDSLGNVAFAGTTTAGAVIIPSSAAPAQTAAGSLAWDSDDQVLTVGTGSGTKRLYTSLSAPVLKYISAAVVQTWSGTSFSDVLAQGGTMSFAIAANEVWSVSYYLPITWVGTGGVKFQLTGPATPTAVMIYAEALGTVSTNAAATEFNQYPVMMSMGESVTTAFSTPFLNHNGVAVGSLAALLYNDTYEGLVRIEATIINGATAGTVTLQRGQNSSAGSMTMVIGGRMRAERMA